MKPTDINKVELPSWTETASRERLLEHMTFLLREKRKYELLTNKRYKVNKQLQDKVEECKEEIKLLKLNYSFPKTPNGYAIRSGYREACDNILAVFDTLFSTK